MNALVWLGPREMAWREEPLPEPAAGQVRLRVEAVGICGSELSGYLGHNSLRVPPLVMGHEFSGVVEAVGPAAGAEASGAGDALPGRAAAVGVGDRVVVNPLLSCGECGFCVGGHENLCLTRALIGAHLPGAFAERVVVPAAACWPLPDDVDFVTGSLAEPLACAVRAVSLARSGDPPHDGPPNGGLHVIGAGPIGLLCARVARRAGFREVSIHDPNEERMALAASWGVAGSSRAPGAADAAIDAVGLEVTRRDAIQAVRRGGTAVFIGLHAPQAAFDGNDLVRDEKVVRGCFAYTHADFARAVELLATDTVPPAARWVDVRDLREGRACFEELTGPAPASVKIVLRPNGQSERTAA